MSILNRKYPFRSHGLMIAACAGVVLAAPSPSSADSTTLSSPFTAPPTHSSTQTLTLPFKFAPLTQIRPIPLAVPQYRMPNGWKGDDPKKLDNMSIEPRDPQYRIKPNSDVLGGGLNNNGFGGGLGNQSFGGKLFDK